MQTISAENLFARSWDLLTRNWLIVVPGLVVAVLSGILTSLLLPSVVVYDEGGVTVTRWFGGFSSLLATVIEVLAWIVVISYTTGMAGAAWRTGSTTFADGAAAFQRDGGRVFTAMLALFVVCLVAAVLVLPTLGLSFVALFFLCLYTMAAAVIGEHGGFGALGESYRIATQNVATTAIVVIAAAAISWVGGFIGAALHFAPIVGPVLSDAVRQVVLAYLTLVIVGAYLAYGSAPLPGGTGPPPAAPLYEPPPPAPPMTP